VVPWSVSSRFEFAVSSDAASISIRPDSSRAPPGSPVAVTRPATLLVVPCTVCIVACSANPASARAGSTE